MNYARPPTDDSNKAPKKQEEKIPYESRDVTYHIPIENALSLMKDLGELHTSQLYKSWAIDGFYVEGRYGVNLNALLVDFDKIKTMKDISQLTMALLNENDVRITANTYQKEEDGSLNYGISEGAKEFGRITQTVIPVQGSNENLRRLDVTLKKVENLILDPKELEAILKKHGKVATE